MTILINATITTAGTVAGTPFQIESRTGMSPMNIMFQKLFTYGSGGTTVDTYVQTSVDGGTTWCDVIHYAQNTTSSDARSLLFNVSSVQTLAAAAAPVPSTDGTLTVNTTAAGIFGFWWRVKFVSVGTYAGGTTLRVDADGVGLVPAGVGA